MLRLLHTLLIGVKRDDARVVLLLRLLDERDHTEQILRDRITRLATVAMYASSLGRVLEQGHVPDPALLTRLDQALEAAMR